MAEEIRGRLKGAQRIVIKAGTSVVSTPEGYPSLVRLANIVEQVRPNTRFWGGLGCV
jgi:glutamate 5-kinase